MQAQTPQQINIVIAEDHLIVRVGLRLTLQSVFNIQAEAVDGSEAVRLVKEWRPDVVLMDISMPAIDGITATGMIKAEFPETKVIMLTSQDGDRDVFAALAAGADGYCLKDVTAEQLVAAIQAVATGVAWLDPRVASRVLRGVSGTTEAQNVVEGASLTACGAVLSEREMHVLRLVVEGLNNQAIAARLVISVDTVKTHMRHLLDKMAVSDRTQAAVKAIRAGFI